MNTLQFVVRAGLVLAAAVAAMSPSAPASAATVTTGHTGSGAPGLASTGDRLYLAWAGSHGTAAAKSVVFGWSTSGGLRVVKAGITEKTPQHAAPALLADPDAPGVIMAWPDARNGNTLTLMRFDGSAFSCRTSLTGVVTHHSPALATDSSGKSYVAWTDPAGFVNVAWLTPGTCAGPTGAMTLTLPARLSVRSPYGPALAFDTTGRTDLRLMLSWISDDAAHTLNLASWGGSTTLFNQVVIATYTFPAAGPSLSVSGSTVYGAFPAGDRRHSVNTCGDGCFSVRNTGVAVSSGIGQEAGGRYHAFFDPAGNLVVATGPAA